MFRKSFWSFHRKPNEQLQDPDKAIPRHLSNWSSSTANANLGVESSSSTTDILSIQKESIVEASDGGPLGLSVVYSPRNGHCVDIVFVHGLGGTSRHTWSKNQNKDLFWPQTFLSVESDLCKARVMTFGYNATLRKAGGGSVSILDFAKGLLFDLQYSRDDTGESLHVGDVPIIFVVHSMGGLVVKEAYMLGQNDPKYRHIIKAVVAVAFLATPHRGSDLADKLNKILQSTLVTSSKQYIAELSRNAPNLEKINQQFRLVIPKLEIVSFYETRPTPIGIRSYRVMIVEKESSVLGYPGETSKALDANHHTVCKYSSRNDPNYIAVRNFLSYVVRKATSTSSSTALSKNRLRIADTSNQRDLQTLRTILAVPDLPVNENDYNFYRDQWTSGTSEWILDDKAFLEWRHASSSSKAGQHRVLWLHGGPGAGKSVLSSFVIDRLVKDGCRCQYFYIRFGDQKKRTLGLLLRSLAFQVAQNMPDFRAKVLTLADQAIRLETADARFIWLRVFQSLLFTMEDIQEPLFWVLDGLDEAEDPPAIVQLLSDLPLCKVPLRVLLVSRQLPKLALSLQKLPADLHVDTISMDGHQLDDIRHCVKATLSLSGPKAFQEDIARQIVESAQNNFLWVRLAVSRVNDCHRQADVEVALQQIPAGMEALYDRMATMIVDLPSPADRDLAKSILQYVICALRDLSVAELSQAMDESIHGSVLDLRHSIVELCGGFVVLDVDGNVTTVHQTAREYLLREKGNSLCFDRSAVHEELFCSCFRLLADLRLRGKIVRGQCPAFLDYAATSWPSHMVSSRLDQNCVRETMKKFLTSVSVLTWIEYLAGTSQLHVLVRASKALTRLSTKLRSSDDDVQRRKEANLFESWAVDLSKIASKFHTSLSRHPPSIQKLVAPFCPHESSIYQQFGKKEAAKLAVSGLSMKKWDDLAAHIPLRNGLFASSMAVSGNLLFVLAEDMVLVYNSSTLEETQASPIVHDEYVSMIQANRSTTLLVTYGYRTAKIWDTASGKCVATIPNPESRPSPLAITFIKNSTRLLIGFSDEHLRYVSWQDPSPTWTDFIDLQQPDIETEYRSAPNYMALNEDGSMVAISYGTHPPSAWETDGPVHIGDCRRLDSPPNVSRSEMIHAEWLPQSLVLVGLYRDGVVFRWNPYEDDVEQQIVAGANHLSLSHDGSVFVTGNGRGTVKVFTTTGFVLLYQLSSQDPVFDIAFSPHSSRFYDLRDTYVNVWESNAVMGFLEGRDSGSGSDGFDSGSDTYSSGLDLNSHTVPTVLAPSVDAIQMLSYAEDGRFYFSGTMAGSVHLYDVRHDRRWTVRKTASRIAIQQLTCSRDGQYVFFCDMGRKVIVKSITSPSDNNSCEDLVMETKAQIPIKEHGPIMGLLCHRESTHLLVQTVSSLQVVCLASYHILCSSDTSSTQRWIQHPQDDSLLLGFGLGEVLVLDWQLEEKARYVYDVPFLVSSLPEPKDKIPSETNAGKVESVLVSQENRYILVQTCPNKTSEKTTTLHYFETSQFAPTLTPQTPVKVDAVKVFNKSNSSRVRKALSMLSQNRLVFLSQTYSVCIWSLENDTGSVQELFSLPDDWVNQDSVDLCTVWNQEKVFLCPRNGEVAVVKCAALARVFLVNQHGPERFTKSNNESK